MSADVAASEAGSRLRAVHLAERQLIGCLLRENGLFTEPLAQGRGVDEAVPPEALIGEAHRRLYGKLYERLGEGEPVSLTGLLSDLASEDEADLAGVCVQADADVEQALRYSDLTVRDVFRLAADRVLRHESAERFRQEKGAVLDGVRTGAPSDEAAARALRWVQERLADAPSPVRIARFRGS